MSVCVVGNAPNEIGTENGDLIDSYDSVYRCNNFTTDGFEGDYGVKTDFWVNTFARDIKFPSEKKHLKIYCPLPLHIPKYLKRYNFTNVVEFIKNRERCEFVDVDVFEKLLEYVPNPSAGVSTIYHLFEKGLLTSEEQMFGFSFFKKGEQHYFDKGVKTQHNGKTEKEFIHELFN